MSKDLYHVNPKTGRVGRCSASREDCPFGTEDSHHGSTAEARAAFERSQEQFLLPTAVRKGKPVKIFRVGELEPQDRPSFEELARVLEFMDGEAPEGRTGRMGALFASPDMASHGRWVRGSEPATSYELTVDPDSVYIYPIKIYEDASLSFVSGRLDRAREEAQEYWESGMTLTEWREWSSTLELERGSWEILLPASAIQAARPMSNRRIIENVNEEDADEINWKLEPRRAFKGLIWRKEQESQG